MATIVSGLSLRGSADSIPRHSRDDHYPGLVGAGAGGAGALVGETIKGGTRALANARYERLTLEQKTFLNSNAVIRDPNAKSVYSTINSLGNSLSIVVSNSGPAVTTPPPKDTRK